MNCSPSLPKSFKYLLSRCWEPLNAFSGGVWGSKQGVGVGQLGGHTVSHPDRCIHVSNEKKTRCLGDLLGMKYYPVV